MAVFWNVAPRRLINDRRFREAYCLHQTNIRQILNIFFSVHNKWFIKYLDTKECSYEIFQQWTEYCRLLKRTTISLYIEI